jgi:hypothetical protein
MLGFRSGGWVLLLAALLCLGILGSWLVGLLSAERQPMIGDGRTVASYGFDLSTCLVPRDHIVASPLPKDGLPALTDPEIFTIPAMEEYARQLRRGHQGKFLVDPDRVIGVVAGGEARAYPLKILNWHEVVNDQLGGSPIAVTYSPLCDSAVVFDRRVGDGTLEFGVSGLLYNSNLLMYDRCPSVAAESLWSQLQFRAVAGPGAGRGQRLRIVPFVLVHWSDWRERHPDTTVLAPDRARLKLYKRTYSAYFASAKLLFPVEPLPKPGRPLKTPILAVDVGAGWQVYDLAELSARIVGGATWHTTQDDVDLRFALRTDPPVAWPETADGGRVPAVPALWFAWHATRPSD